MLYFNGNSKTSRIISNILYTDLIGKLTKLPCPIRQLTSNYTKRKKTKKNFKFYRKNFQFFLETLQLVSPNELNTGSSK